MKSRYKNLILIFLFLAVPKLTLHAQNKELKREKRQFKRLTFYDIRGTNAFDFALGTAIPNGDLTEPAFEIYMKGGYKRFITEHFSIGIAYNKYNIAFDNVYNEGFMSFDVNLEYLLSPFRGFSPFLYAGYGYNAANYFENTATKVQGAFGFEVLLVEKLALRLFAEYNYMFNDELDGVIAGAGDDTFIRGGLGLHIYFGGNKRKARLYKRIKTVINSNLILPDN
jgi:curli production assembly/transport component CsgG